MRNLRIWLQQKQIFAHALLEKRAGKAVWNKGYQSSCWCLCMWWRNGKKTKSNHLSIGQQNLNMVKRENWVKTGSGANSRWFRMCATANMATYAIEMTKFEVKCNLLILQPRSSQLLSENYVITKYEVILSSNSSISIIIHYYTEGDVDLVHYTTSIASFHAKIKIFKSCCIFYENTFFKPRKGKGDWSYLHKVVALNFCFQDVLAERLLCGKKPERIHLCIECNRIMC